MQNGSGVAAIFGANSVEGVSIVQSIADSFSIPFLFSLPEVTMYANGTAINLFPYLRTLTEVSFILVMLITNKITQVGTANDNYFLGFRGLIK